MVIIMIYVTWYGTASVKIEYKDTSILFDPFIRVDKINDSSFLNNFICDNVFITHGHIDHTLDLPIIYNNKKVIIHATDSPYKRLLKEGFDSSSLTEIKPGDKFRFGDINVEVLKGKHIRFNIPLIIETLFNKNVIKYSKYLPRLIVGHLTHHEAGETVAYYITIDKTKILLMGSMALDSNTNYPTDVDYFILPFQGRTDLNKKVVPIINKIHPKNVILSHFDNSFPPISTDVDISKLNTIISPVNLIIPKYDTKIPITEQK